MMKFISPAQGLVRKLEEGEEINPAKLQRALPRGLRHRFTYFASEIGMLNLAYVVSIASFYDNGERAFYRALWAPAVAKKHNEKSRLTHKKFYERQKKAYENRCAHGVPHQLRFLEAAVDFSSNMWGNAGWTSSGLGDPSPWRENAVRALEDAPRAIEDMNHVWDRQSSHCLQ